MTARIIDADTHLIETAAIWEHLTSKESVHRPQAVELDQAVIVPPIVRPMKSVWIIDARSTLEQVSRSLKRYLKGRSSPGRWQ